jgi:hypothetical protein
MSFTIDYLTLDKFSPDPSSPEDGDLWYNEATDTIKIHAESITRSLVDNILFTTHTGSLLNPHEVTKAQIGLSSVTDDPQLLRSGNDFSLFTEKGSPVGADILLIEDSEDSGNKKWVLVSSLPSSGGINEEQHRLLDTLTHDLDESYDAQYTLDSDGLITQVTGRDQSGSPTIRNVSAVQVDSDGMVTGVTLTQHDGSGSTTETLTLTTPAGVPQPGSSAPARWTRS